MSGSLSPESVWVNKSFSPEYYTESWSLFYEHGQPDNSGDCLLLSNSSDYLYKDEVCGNDGHAPLCEPNYDHDCDCNLGYLDESQNILKTGDDADKLCGKDWGSMVVLLIKIALF